MTQMIWTVSEQMIKNGVAKPAIVQHYTWEEGAKGSFSYWCTHADAYLSITAMLDNGTVIEEDIINEKGEFVGKQFYIDGKRNEILFIVNLTYTMIF